MNSRERYLTALEHRETDKVPFSWGLGVNPPVQKALGDRLGLDAEGVLRWMDSMTDERHIQPAYAGPASRNCWDQGAYVDIWGVKRAPVSYGAGYYDEISFYPLSGASTSKDLDRHVWPSADWFDFSGVFSACKQSGEPKAIFASNGNILEQAWYMRGFERMFLDLVEEPELLWDILTRVTDFFVSFFARYLEAARGCIDVVFTADDVGGQQGPLLSPSMWKRMIQPHHRRLDAVIHSYGAKVMYHSDGAIMEFLQGFHEMGVDIVEALQFDAAGMDPAGMKQAAGGKLCFRGGISVQSTLPFGTAEDVRREVRERIAVLGHGGGYILAPSHAIQANTPVDNVLAMLEECGRL